MSVAPSRAILRKNPPRHHVAPNLADYAQAAASFSWDGARAELDGLPGGKGVNIAHEAVDRHAAGARGGAVALRWLSASGPGREFSYRELASLSNRFANALTDLGIAKGDRIFVLAPRLPELYIAALGTWKLGALFCPLFSAFGTEPIHTRMTLGENVLGQNHCAAAPQSTRARPAGRGTSMLEAEPPPAPQP